MTADVPPTLAPPVGPVRLVAPPPEPAPLQTPPARRARRLDVGRDLVASELLAPPVALRGDGVPWR